MKIILLDTFIVRRGAQVFFEELGEKLIQKKINVKKIYLYEYKSDVTIKINKTDLLLNGNSNSLFEKFPTVNPFLLKKLIKAIIEFKPDFIILNGSRTLKYASLAKLFLKEKPKLIYRIIDSVVFWNPSLIKQFYYKNIILKNIDAAVGVSQASLNDVQQLYKFNKPSIVIHRSFNINNINLKDKNFEKELIKKKQNDFIVLFLGNFTYQKRPEKFVQTIKILKDQLQNIQGWMVGDGILKKEVELEIKKHNLENSITLWGYQKNVFPFIKASNVLLITSDTEGLPGIVLEAAYLKVPTVSGNVGGVKEFICDNSIGIVTDYKDVNVYANNIKYILLNKDVSINMGKNAQEKLLTEFNLDSTCEKYINFLNKITSGKN